MTQSSSCQRLRCFTRTSPDGATLCLVSAHSECIAADVFRQQYKMALALTALRSTDAHIGGHASECEQSCMCLTTGFAETTRTTVQSMTVAFCCCHRLQSHENISDTVPSINAYPDLASERFHVNLQHSLNAVGGSFHQDFLALRRNGSTHQ